MGKKYENCIYDTPWDAESFEEKHRLLMIDKGGPVPSKFLSNTTWYHKASPNGKGHHVSDCPELLAWIGSDPQDPQNLYGEITVYMNGEKHVMNKSFILQTPAHVPHCPYVVTRADRPQIHIATPCDYNMKVTQLPELPLHDGAETHYYDNYFVTDAKHDPRKLIDGEVHVLYGDGELSPGGIVCRASWFTKDVPGGIEPMHKHDFDELLLFMGSDWEKAFELGCEVEFTLGGEAFTINKTCYVAVPSGVAHGGFKVRNLTRPLFVAAYYDTPHYNEVLL